MGHVAAIRNGSSKATKDGLQPYVALEHIRSGGALIGRGQSSDSVSVKTQFFKGDTLFGKLRPNLRKVIRAEFDGVCSTELLAIFAIGHCYSRFLNHLLRSDTLHSHAMQGITGTKMPRTSWRHLKTFQFISPPLPEQRAIATVLDSIDDAIARTETVITATGQLRDSLLHQLLTRGVPGWHTEWKEAPGLGTIPADWEVVRLGEVAEVNPRRPRLKVPANEPVTFLPMAAIAENSQGIIARDSRPYFEISNGYTYFEENDFLFSKITPCLENGKHALATGLKGGFGFGTTEFHVVRAGPSLASPFVFRLLTRFNIIDRCAKSFTGTAGQQRIQPETLKALSIPVPSLPEQQAIAELLDGLDMTVAEVRAELDALQSLKESTADALLTGQVRVGGGIWRQK